MGQHISLSIKLGVGLWLLGLRGQDRRGRRRPSLPSETCLTAPVCGHTHPLILTVCFFIGKQLAVRGTMFIHLCKSQKQAKCSLPRRTSRHISLGVDSQDATGLFLHSWALSPPCWGAELWSSSAELRAHTSGCRKGITNMSPECLRNSTQGKVGLSLTRIPVFSQEMCTTFTSW